jgi:hypothetical protein
LEAYAVPKKVTISHRGARYEIGRGKRYYGVWVNGAPESDPVDRWPETPDGWAQAWTRFVALETPGTIAAADERGGVSVPRVRVPRLKGGAAPVAAGLLGLGVVIGIAGLFFDYSGASLASQAYQLVPHLMFLLGWAVSAALIADGVRRGQPGGATRGRIGALLGAGLSVVTFGLLLSDVGQAVALGPAAFGAGLILTLIGWAACAAGSAAGLAVRRQATGTQATGTQATSTQAVGGPGRPVRPGREHAGPITLLVLSALGTVAAFAPSWDSYTLSTTGGSQTITAGNAFSNPALVITANVIVMVVVVAVAFAAALWRPARQGAALLAGAIVPMVAQAISAVIQIGQPASPAQFGISPSEAGAAGLSITAGLTAVFWVYCVFVIALAISCAWLLTEPVLPATASPLPSPWAADLVPGGAGKSGDKDRGDDDGPGGGAENSYA